MVIEAGDSNKFKPGQLVTIRQVRRKNSALKRDDLKSWLSIEMLKQQHQLSIIGYYEVFFG